MTSESSSESAVHRRTVIMKPVDLRPLGALSADGDATEFL